jgi:hypothetical protein
MGKRDWYVKLRKGGTKTNPSSGRVVGTRGPYKTKTNAVSAGNRLINGYELPTGVKLVVEQGDVGVPKAPAAKKTNPKRNPAYFRVKPLDDFHLAGTQIRLDKTKTYWAMHATNLPDWKAKGKVFLQVERDGSPAVKADLEHADGFLLQGGDYWRTMGRNNPKHPRRKNAGIGKNAYVQFFTFGTSGDLHEAMGSDGVLILDGRDSLDTAINDAYTQADRLKNVKKFGGFQIRKGTGRSMFGDFRPLTQVITLSHRQNNPKRKHPRRKNTHLIVGETAKFSQDYLDFVRYEGGSNRLPFDTLAVAKKARFRVYSVDPGGYHVTDITEWPPGRPWLTPYYFADHKLVAADSTSRKFPGTGYKGKTPRRKNAALPAGYKAIKKKAAALKYDTSGKAQVKPGWTRMMYPNDLLEHDKTTISEHPRSSFLWFISEYGTHVLMLPDKHVSDEQSMKDLSLFDYLVNQYHDGIYQDAIYYWDGKTLKKLPPYKARWVVEEATGYTARYENPRRKNPAKWAQAVDKEMEERGTVGAFTKQARRAGYSDTMEFARKVMAGWRSGKKTVYNKKTRRQQKITQKTMYRANFAINVQKRNPSHIPSHRKNTPILSQTPHPQRNNGNWKRSEIFGGRVMYFKSKGERFAEMEKKKHPTMGHEVYHFLVRDQKGQTARGEVHGTLAKAKKVVDVALAGGDWTRALGEGGTLRNPYFPKPAYAAKKRKQYKMNPRKNASPYRALVKREMPRLRRQGYSPADAMKMIGTMWKRRMKR